MNGAGVRIAEDAVRFERELKAPIDRVWAHLVDPELRGLWFAGGAIDPRPGGEIVFHHRHQELTPADDDLPEKYRDMDFTSRGRITRFEPPALLAFDWLEEDGSSQEVTINLTASGDATRLVLTHTRLPDRATMVDVAGGWHLHLDLLASVLEERSPGAYWAAHAEQERAYAEQFQTGA
jgi:uncharacterized protein YndB with AHSA1/START domain